MKKLVYSLVAMCCILSFVGCDKEFENKANIIRLSDENLTHRFFNGDDVAFYYECQFATDVKFEIMVKNSSTVLHTETASITPGEGILTFNIETDGYEGHALLCLTYHQMSSHGKVVSTHWYEVTITTRGSWYYENEAIDKLLKGCKDFDADTLVSGLVDEWERDSYLKYNDDWSKIIEPYLVIGYDYVEGLAYEKYNFNADGTGWHSVNPAEPDMETMTYDFNWCYDAESNQLTLSGEYNHKWRVTGCNDNNIVLDETTTIGDNLRTILWRSLL